MALILPKGIVVNSPETAGSIERHDAEPLDLADIAKFWKVYTTTQRRLRDPTAERLENLWWRIWGSRKKALRGAAVARLFTRISDGETFVPLLGPPNRYEGTTPPLRAHESHGPTVSASNTSLHRSNPSRSSTIASSSSNSKSQASMPHPILKKNRGPSTTGPRPTARFISPPESGNEQELESSASANSHVVVQPPTPIEPQHSSVEPSPLAQGADATVDKKPANASLGKKKANFVASKKKRPVIVRRQNSQSSTDNIGRASEAVRQTSAPIMQSSAERTSPMPSAQSRKAQRSKFQENFSPSSGRPSTHSKPLKEGDSKSENGRGAQKDNFSGFGTIDEDQPVEANIDEPGPSNQLRQIENSQNSEAGIEPTAEQVEVQRVLLEDVNNRMETKQEDVLAPTSPTLADIPEGPAQILHKSLRSNSDMTYGFHDMHAMRLLHNHQNKSNASLAPTLTTVSGEIELGDSHSSGGDSSNSNTPKKLDKGKGKDSEDSHPTEMFAKIPVQPVQAPPASEASILARSMSQLTLMLKRDRARSGEHKSDSEQHKSIGKS